MTSTPRIVVFGNSVFLAGIKAQLKSSTHAKLITVGLENPDVVTRIRRHNPTAVIFDLSIGYADLAISLLKDTPGLLLIGVMPSSDEMVLLSGEHSRAQSIQDLMQVISGLPNANRARERRFDSKRLRELIAAATTLISTRRQKLAFAVGIISLCSILILTLAQSSGSSSTPAPLVGTAWGDGISPEIGLAFVVGFVLGGIVIALWLRGYRRA